MASGIDRRRRRFGGSPLAARGAPRLRSALALEHARTPFHPGDVRDAARRVAGLCRSLDFEPVTIRGGLDVGGAELDHVWVVVDRDVVIDVALPLRAPSFVDALRRYVADEISASDLAWRAHAYGLDWRVVGQAPAGVRYTGAPVL